MISGAGPVGLKYLAQFRESFVEIHPLRLKRSAMHQCPNRSQLSLHLPQETIVLPIQYVRDWAGNSYLSRDVFSRIAAASTALSMRFQTLIWERARLVDTLCTWEGRGSHGRCSRTDPSRKGPGSCRPRVVQNAVSRVGRSCEASRQSGRRSQTHRCGTRLISAIEPLAVPCLNYR